MATIRFDFAARAFFNAAFPSGVPAGISSRRASADSVGSSFMEMVRTATSLVRRAQILGTVAVLFAIPVFSQEKAPSFDVASIRPSPPEAGRNSSEDYSPGGRFDAVNATLHTLLALAYNVKDNQIAGGPASLDRDRYNIEARAEGDPGQQQMRVMLQSLLANRFGLVIHREMRETSVYALLEAKGGMKMKESPPLTAADADNQGITNSGRGQVSGRWTSMRNLANVLTRYVGRTVVDETGMTGSYDFSLDFAAGETVPIDVAPEGDSARAPSVFTALPDQVGLRLEAKKIPVDLRRGQGWETNRELRRRADDGGRHALFGQGGGAHADEAIRGIGHVERDRHKIIGQGATGGIQSHRGENAPQEIPAEIDILAQSGISKNAVTVTTYTNGYLVLHFRGGGARTFRVCEDVEVGERHRFNKLERFFEERVGFAGEADHHVGADGRVGHETASGFHSVGIMPRSILAVHAAEDCVGAGLQWGVDVFRDAGIFGHQVKQVVCEIHRLDRAEPDPLDFGFVEEAEEEIGEAHRAACFPAPSSEIDAGEDDFAISRSERADLGDYIVRADESTAAAHEGNDAEGAAIVAAILNFQIWAGAIGKPFHDRSGQDISGFENISDQDLAVVFEIVG